jgi:VanZ family protein
MAPDSSRRSRLATAICLVTGLYWLAIFALTHAPIVPTPNFGHSLFYSLDKVAHLGVFVGLALLLCAAGTSLGHPQRQLFAAVSAIAAVYGAFDEFTQQFVAHRSPEFGDWIADMLGAGLGITLFAVAREMWLAIRRRVTAA